MQSVIDAINDKANVEIDETYTKKVPKEKKFTTFDSMVPKMANFNHQADVLILPKTKEGYIGLLVVKDLGVHSFDIEPIKNKEAKTMLDALQKIYKREYLKKPKYSLSTDDGSEFKGVFHKWLYEQSIFQKIAAPNRHSQQAVVERQNETLSRLLNGYMNAKEEQTGKAYNEWTDVLDIVRKKLNKVQKRDEQNWITSITKITHDFDKEPKYKVGDLVYYKTDTPLNALGHQQPTKQFRTGDYRWNIKEPRKIEKILYYPKPVNFRYLLEDKPNVSFTEEQLRKAKGDDSKYVVQAIIGKKFIKGKPFYLVWWKGELKKNATLEPRQNLIEDGFENELKEFDKNVDK